MGKRDFICEDCGQAYQYAWEHAKACPGSKTEQRHLTPKEQQALHKALSKSADPKPSTVASQSIKRKEKPSTERTRRYRERHGEVYTEQRRLYMRKWRAQPNE